MTTTPAGDGQPGAAEQAIHDALQRIDRIERRLQLDQHLQMVPAATEPFVSVISQSKSGQTVAMVMAQLLAGHDLSGCDNFWIEQARRELDRRVAERERVVQAGTKALICRSTRSPRARQFAIAVLTAAGHPAFTDPVIASVPIGTVGGQAATA